MTIEDKMVACHLAIGLGSGILIGMCINKMIAKLGELVCGIKEDAKEEEREEKPRKWVMPDDKTEEMFALWNKWEKDDDRLARYKFWKMVREEFP